MRKWCLVLGTIQPRCLLGPSRYVLDINCGCWHQIQDTPISLVYTVAKLASRMSPQHRVLVTEWFPRCCQWCPIRCVMKCSLTIFFTSYDLLAHFKSLGIKATGTVQEN